ncbi:FlgD immunoglobulin-like domain containing protein [Streptomyces sp. NPDC005408]|uniref:FG-GAP-like repeat-containing protein n=1 Tax=Streptomyces sp. NPDC005408 TaxID=3155341 RepID=UPI0033A542DA
MKSSGRRTRTTLVIASALAMGASLVSAIPAVARTAVAGTADTGTAEDVVITLGIRGGRVVPPEGLALAGGRLHVTGWAESEPMRSLYEYDLAVTGSPTAGPRRLVVDNFWNNYPCPEEPGQFCSDFDSRLWGLGDGRIGYQDPWGVDQSVGGTRKPKQVTLQPERRQDRVTSAAGRYIAVYDGFDTRVGDFDGDPGAQYIADGRPASVWGTTVWARGERPGTVRSFELKTRTESADIDLGMGCTADELQVVGRWLYWRCAGVTKAGVWDFRTRKNIAVPSQDGVRLGDGFLVWHEPLARRMELVDFHKGGGFPYVEQTFASDVSAGAWDVDRFGGHVAFTDTEGRIHIRPVTVPRQPVVVTDLAPEAGFGPWQGDWRLSRPAASWTVTIKDPYGNVVKEIRGRDREGASVRAGWNGSDSNGSPVPGGAYTWTLSVDAGDGTGERDLTSGSLSLTRDGGGRSAFRDTDADGYGEMFSMTTGGKLAIHHLSRDSGSWTSTGWDPLTRFVSAGDLTGDGCGDVVARTPDGNLWRYAPGCGNRVTPTTPRTLVGAGWGGFDAIVPAADNDVFRTPDLIARQASTGRLYLYPGNAGVTGYGRPVLIGSGWNGYTIMGAADLTGDGIGDLVARDSGGEVWRYDGLGGGKFLPRKLLLRDWGAGRREMMVVGDVTRDGYPDLVSRHADGRLLRNEGNAAGGFGATVTIGTGWGAYARLY